MFSTLVTLVLLAPAADAAAATVNGEVIRLADVDGMLARFSGTTGLPLRAQRDGVLEELIDETLLRQHLAKHGPATDPQEIGRHLAALQAAQKAQGKALAEFLRETGLTEARLRSSFDTSIRLQKWVESRSTDADRRAFFVERRAHFEGATVTLSHILLRLSPSATDAETAAARERLRVLKGDVDAELITFAQAAAKHSLCITAKDGGHMGTIARADGLVEDAVAAAAFALPIKVVSEPVRSVAGLHLLQVTARTPGTPTTYENCRERVAEAFEDDARAKLVAQLRSEATLRITLP